MRKSLARLLAILVALGGSAAFAEPTDSRAALATELAEQRETIDRALATVTEKLAAIERDRAARLHATYRALQQPTPDPMAQARRTAALRLIAKRDRDERALLVDEKAQLESARSRIAHDVQAIATIALPDELVRPARGDIARHYGTLLHERSGTTLSRRGIDFDVDLHASVVAPADGTIKYAGELRGLDRGLVIDHGTYVSVLGKLDELLVPVGATVHAGDRIGRAAKHRVYFEVRVRVGLAGMLIDPEPLLRKKRRESNVSPE